MRYLTHYNLNTYGKRFNRFTIYMYINQSLLKVILLSQNSASIFETLSKNSVEFFAYSSGFYTEAAFLDTFRAKAAR